MSFPRYPRYKPSGVEWLGEVPEHWKSTALKRLAKFDNGYPYKPDERGDSGLPIIRISQLTSSDEPAYFDGDGTGHVPIHDGDLLFSWSATIDAYIWSRGQALLNQHIFKVSPNLGVDKQFLYYFIRHVAPKLADVDAHGSTMRHIKKESLGENVALPPLVEQRAIANFLDCETAKIDALVAEQERLIELLKEKRQTVISHTVTKGLDPDAPPKDSGVEWLGDVPEHWTALPIRSLSNGSPGSFIDGDWIEAPYIVDEGIRLIQTGNIGVGQYREQGFRYISDSTFEELRCTEIAPGDLLICRLAEPVGRACQAPDLGVRMITSVDVCILKPRAEYSPRFLTYLMSSRPYLGWMEGQCRGGTRDRVSRSFLGSVRVVVPPNAEQRMIVEFLDHESARIDGLVAEAGRAIALMHERRSALISAAVTGQIDVRDAVPVEVA